MAPQYWTGLLMFCMAMIFTMALGSVLQYHATARHDAAVSLQGEAATASLQAPAVRRASFRY